MSSGRFTTIRLDPFYQQFLRGQFKQKNAVFEFPKGHDFLMFIEHFLHIPPKDHIPLSSNSSDPLLFHIAIPEMNFKDPDCYNYISPPKNKRIARYIQTFIRALMMNRIRELHNIGLEKQDCILILMDDYEINQKYRDRIVKMYDRHMNSERQRRYIKKLKSVKKNGNIFRVNDIKNKSDKRVVTFANVLIENHKLY